jgi:hypothetical protein
MTFTKASLLTLALTLLSLGGCASAKAPPRPLDYPYTRIFQANYEEVWNATVAVLDLYSIVEASRESGVLKTDWSDFRNNRSLYDQPDQDERLDQVRYRISIKLSKGMVSQSGRPAVRLQVVKELSRFGNLVTDWQRIPTDENEERVILYRVGQRLKIARTIQIRRNQKQKLEQKKAAEAAAPAEKDPDEAL